MPQYIGVDLHRRRSVTVRMTEAGEMLGTRRFENSAAAFAEVVEAAGEEGRDGRPPPRRPAPVGDAP